jgi:hypothetical protein
MSLIPDTNHGAVSFFEARQDAWAAHAAQIGTSPAIVAEVAEKAAVARAALAAQDVAQQAARSATAAVKIALRDLRRLGGSVVGQIRAKAATEGDDVYVLAQIPAPAAPSPVPPPGMPTRFTATLDPASGSLRLQWKCPNPAGSQGTIYQVARRVGPAGAGGAFVALGASGTRRFVDATVPAGAASVTYQITAVRSTAVGAAARFTVNLGVSEEVQGGQHDRARLAA